MIVSDDYVLGAPWGHSWPHVVSLRQNPGLIPGRAARTLCGGTTRTLNFAGVFQWWRHTETVCAECKKAAAGGPA